MMSNFCPQCGKARYIDFDQYETCPELLDLSFKSQLGVVSTNSKFGIDEAVSLLTEKLGTSYNLDSESVVENKNWWYLPSSGEIGMGVSGFIVSKISQKIYIVGSGRPLCEVLREFEFGSPIRALED